MNIIINILFFIKIYYGKNKIFVWENNTAMIIGFDFETTEFSEHCNVISEHKKWNPVTEKWACVWCATLGDY